jgi:hypothetical protein
MLDYRPGHSSGLWIAMNENAVNDALPGVAVKDFTYTRRPRPEHKRLRKKFKGVRAAFIMDVARTQADHLRKAGLTEAEIATAAEAGRLPSRFNVHHIKPLDDGGTNDTANLVIMRKADDHELIHRFLDPQLADLPVGRSRQVRLPMPQGGTLYSSKLAHREAAQKALGPRGPMRRDDGR